MRAFLPLLAVVSCHRDEPEQPTAPAGYAPEWYCPGGPGCADVPGAALEAGVAIASVVPDCYEAWTDTNDDAVYQPPGEVFLDCGCDRLCPGDPGYTAPDDGEGDGTFQAVWLGGFQNARAATGVRDASVGLIGDDDGLWARAIVLRQGETTLAIVAIDAVGWMYDDVLNMRQAVADAGLDVDHVVIHSTHGHEGPDTMGIWGPTLSITGYQPEYAAQTYATVVDVVRRAIDGLVPVTLELGEVDANTAFDTGIGNLIYDHRDPQIVDPRIGVARFADASGATVVTLVHSANHPETIADENTLMSSDFAHGLRKTVETGSVWDSGGRAGVGGTCVFLNGTVGGMMTSLGAHVVDRDGVERSSASFDKADAVGQLFGELALDALASAEVAPEPRLAFKAKQFYLPVDNSGFQVMFELGVLGHRPAYHYDPEQVIDRDNRPDVLTEVDVIDIGPLQLLTVPGEVLPELAIGGYDGRFTPPGGVMIEPDNPNPPDLSQAPDGPYLMDRMSGEHNWIVGLGNDEVGYIIPPYNFILDDAAPYFFEADGDHYEETNSLGPDTAPILDEEVRKLTEWTP